MGNASSFNASYFWRETGETDEIIEVNTPGTYTVDVSNGNCTVSKIITLTQIDNPIISSVESDGSNIIITTSNTGDFLYSIDGNIYTPNNVFPKVEGGLYNIYVRQANCPYVATTTHLHFYVPKFFTPNGDGFYDTFDLKGIEYFNYSRVAIFDRYGKLLKNAVNTPFSWNGTFNNEHLPADDYWYIIEIDNQKITGHFTLKR